MAVSRENFFGLKRTASYFIDLLAINMLAYFLPIYFHKPAIFHVYISVAWIVISYLNRFYGVNRHSKVTSILILLFRQFVLIFLVLYAYIGFFKQPDISRLNLAIFFALVFLCITIIKFSKYLFLRIYRKKTKSDLRNVVVIGKNRKTDQLIDVFNNEQSYGYRFFKQFPTKNNDFDLSKCLAYIEENNIDEMYCSIAELEDHQILELIDYADRNFKTVKFVPDDKQLFSKKLNFEYYDYVPVLSLREIPLVLTTNYFIKRGFDILFSSFVIVFLLVMANTLNGFDY